MTKHPLYTVKAHEYHEQARVRPFYGKVKTTIATKDHAPSVHEVEVIHTTERPVVPGEIAKGGRIVMPHGKWW